MGLCKFSFNPEVILIIYLSFLPASGHAHRGEEDHPAEGGEQRHVRVGDSRAAAAAEGLRSQLGALDQLHQPDSAQQWFVDGRDDLQSAECGSCSSGGGGGSGSSSGQRSTEWLWPPSSSPSG